MAYGDGNKNIFLINNKKLSEYYRNQKIEKDPNNKFYLLPEDPLINKIELKYHQESVNALIFAKRFTYNLISASSDRAIIIWYLNSDMDLQNKKLISCNSEVLDLQLNINDQFLFSCCMDNSINIYYTHFNDGGNIELISTLNYHNSIVTSISIDNSTNEIMHNRISVKYASQVI